MKDVTPLPIPEDDLKKDSKPKPSNHGFKIACVIGFILGIFIHQFFF